MTKQGKHLLQAAEKSFEEFSRAEILMKEEEGELQGILKLGIPMNLVPGWFISHMGEFLRQYPNIQLHIIAEDGRVDLKTGQVDVSLTPFIEKRSDSIQELIYTFNLHLYASERYLATFGTPKKKNDLISHKLIIYGIDTPSPYSDINWFLRLGMPKGSIRSPYMCINSLPEMLQAAEDGHGIVELPLEYLQLKKKQLIEILPDIKKPSVPLYYVYPKHLEETQKIKVLGHYLKNKFSLQTNMNEVPKELKAKENKVFRYKS